MPNTYFSDNGTNFVGAERELREWFYNLDQAAIVGKLCRNETAWKFNPPSAPHFGGSWERLVKSAKRALVHVLQGQTLTDEVLNAAFIQVENLLNGRPLTFVKVDATDPEILTPNHLLLGRNSPNMAPFVPTDSDINSRKRYRQLQAMTDHFWRRWIHEYLPTLHERKKWHQNAENLQVEDVVIIIDPNTPRGKWPLGRVTKVHPGLDGVVRSATIKTENSELERPVVKLCVLNRAEN